MEILELAPKEKEKLQADIDKAVAEKRAQDLIDIQQCEEEIQAILLKYNCTLVSDIVTRNGQVIKTAILAVKIKK